LDIAGLPEAVNTDGLRAYPEQCGNWVIRSVMKWGGKLSG